jgi:hypothetical protein
VEVGEPRVVGSGNHEVLQRTVRARLPDFQRCREGTRRRLTGTVVVKYIVTHRGEVYSAFPDRSKVRSPRLRDCVVEVFRELEFDPVTLEAGSWTLWVHQDLRFDAPSAELGVPRSREGGDPVLVSTP